MTINEYTVRIIEILQRKHFSSEYAITASRRNDKPNKKNSMYVSIREKGAPISADFNVESMYNENKSVQEAVEIIIEIYRKDVGNRENYQNSIGKLIQWNDEIKQKLRVRLFNKRAVENTDIEIYAPAVAFGFPDLVFVPYVIFNDEAVIRVTKNVLEIWEQSIANVLAIALANTRESVIFQKMKIDNGFPYIVSMYKMTQEEIKGKWMLIVSNDDYKYGSASAVLNIDKIKELFPDGLYACPSSVHEMIFCPKDFMSKADADEMVRAANMNVVDKEDWLSDNAYEIV